MSTCPSCGSEVSGEYCDICGARVGDARRTASVKPSQAKPPQAPSVEARPSEASAAVRPSRVRSPVTAGARAQPAPAVEVKRPGRKTALVLLGVGLFGAGFLSGLLLGRGVQTPASALQPSLGVDQATINAMTPLAQADYFMESGVAMMNLGQRAAAVAEFRKAITAFKAVLEAEPDNLYAATYLGLTYYYAGDEGQARQTLEAVLERDPSYLWAIFNLAWIHETEGRTADALALYQRYLDVVEQERQNPLKYAEQSELIDKQIGAAQQAVARLTGGGDGK